MSPGALWPNNLTKVIPLSTIVKMKSHRDYNAAKSGDIDAAYRLTNDILNGKKQRQKIEEFGLVYPTAILVGVHAVEAMGKNKIPESLAQMIGIMANLNVDEDIVQSVKVVRTGSDSVYRLAYRPKFTGKVQPGNQYILVDDVVTGGGTFGELRYYIECQGGKVVDMVCMAASKFSTNIVLTEKTQLSLENNYDIVQLSNFLKEFDIYGGNYRYLTESEGRTLLRIGGLDKAREKIIETKRIGIKRLENAFDGHMGQTFELRSQKENGQIIISKQECEDKNTLTKSTSIVHSLNYYTTEIRNEQRINKKEDHTILHRKKNQHEY